ncbi:hypothetical protein VTN00DRAFT_2444 [Thermoascus crustaceus]|uniref:uncharacterized protein n=1 Tax=Thermoascus crustaceus TaxID=5088 RepID=UPI0037432E3A
MTSRQGSGFLVLAAVGSHLPFNWLLRGRSRPLEKPNLSMQFLLCDLGGFDGEQSARRKGRLRASANISEANEIADLTRKTQAAKCRTEILRIVIPRQRRISRVDVVDDAGSVQQQAQNVASPVSSTQSSALATTHLSQQDETPDTTTLSQLVLRRVRYSSIPRSFDAVMLCSIPTDTFLMLIYPLKRSS